LGKGSSEAGWTKIHATFWENIKAEFWNGFCHAFFKSGFATLFSKAVLPRFFQKRFCHAFFKSGFATLFSKAVLPRFFQKRFCHAFLTCFTAKAKAEFWKVFLVQPFSKRLLKDKRIK